MKEKTDKEFYEELSGKKLTDQEVFEAKRNFIGFFDLLLKMDRRNKQKQNEKTKNN